MLNEYVICTIIVLLCLAFLLIGYCFGVYTQGVYENNTIFTSAKKKDKNIIKTDISIDEKKHIVDIKTEGFEKKYSSLGDIKESSEDINSSINKLKNLKK